MSFRTLMTCRIHGIIPMYVPMYGTQEIWDILQNTFFCLLQKKKVINIWNDMREYIGWLWLSRFHKSNIQGDSNYYILILESWTRDMDECDLQTGLQSMISICGCIPCVPNAHYYFAQVCLYLSLFEGGVLVITEVGEGWVGIMESNPWWRGSEPGRTIVGVGVELAAVLGGTSCKIVIKQHYNIALVQNITCSVDCVIWPNIKTLNLTMPFLMATGSLTMATASLLFVMLEAELGLSGGEESISRGPPLSLFSVGVCRIASLWYKIN